MADEVFVELIIGIVFLALEVVFYRDVGIII
jgi:hypothetical protein